MCTPAKGTFSYYRDYEMRTKTKMQMTQSFNQYSENETKIWRQNILNQFNRVPSSCLRSHFVISLLKLVESVIISLSGISFAIIKPFMFSEASIGSIFHQKRF